MSPGALRLTGSTTDVDDVPLADMDGREDVGGDKGVAECKPPFWSMGAGGVVNGSAVYRPSFDMLGGGGLIKRLVLVLRSAVLLLGISLGDMRSPLLDSQFEPWFGRTGGGVIQKVSFNEISDVADG